MNDDKKPREFWIHRESLADNDIDAVYSQCWVAKSPVDEDDCYNVIEKSAYDALAKENERLKENLSYLPKVPTQPYEKEMAKQIFNLQKENEELKLKLADLKKMVPLWRSYFS